MSNDLKVDQSIKTATIPASSAGSNLLPLSPAQTEICIGQQLDPASPLYNMGMMFDIHGDLDVQKLISAWDLIVQDSDALRMQLTPYNGQIMQYPGQKSVPTTVLDNSHSADGLARARHWIQNDLEQAFSLEGPLVQATIVKVSSKQWIWYCKQHHIITDATSFAVVWQKMAEIYSAASDNAGIESQYLDYVVSQLSVSSAPDQPPVQSSLSRMKLYWQNKQIPPSPTLYGRKPTQTSTAASRKTDFLDPARAQQLESLVQQKEIRSISSHLARFQVLLTILFAYLYRVSGQTSLAIATTSPNRSDKRYENTPGLFVELLPLCIEIETNETFSTLLLKVKAEMMTFFKNATPGAGSWTSNRDISVVLNYVPLVMNPLDGMAVNTEWLHANHMDRQHALRMHATDWNDSGQLSLAFDTNDSCFTADQSTAARLHWLALFDAFSESRSTLIDSVNIASNYPSALSTPDIHQSSPDTVNSQSKDSLIARFEKIVDTFPTYTAIVQGAEQISYEVLAARVDYMARQLLQLGIGPNHNVVILLPRCLSVPVVLLGILKTGATYIPIDSNNPANRIATLLNDSGASLIITNTSLSSKLDPHQSVLIIDDVDSTVQQHSNPVVSPAITAQSDTGNAPAYILYTSGTTGTPKGVAISRTAMLNYCAWAVDYYTRGQPLAFAFFTPIGFDLTITSLFVPLLSGGTIHIYPTTSDDIDDSLLAVIADNRADVLKLTPPHLSILHQQNLADSRISQLIVGGEDLKCQLALNIHQAFDGKVIIHNEYGPTEATVGCIVHQFNPETDKSGSVPIGKPVAGMQATILNHAGQPQPDGVSGMLYLSGPSLANGYWNNKPQTESVFLSLKDSEILHYKSGDLVRVNESGLIVYLGREDNQRKIRGARVELAEIESTVVQETNALDCVVTSIKIDTGQLQQAETFCNQCGLSSHYPDATIDQTGTCSLCNAFSNYEHKAQLYFKSTQALQKIVTRLQARTRSQYDCMMLLSGGKDSTYALAQLVDMGLSVLAYTLDNGYISTDAKTNIKQVCTALGVDHEFGQTPAMRKIFSESLEQHSNVCNGCFKTIYTLSMLRANELAIAGIFTGLSRGQFFETRLTEELFSSDQINNETIDATVLSARKAYHRIDDIISREINTDVFQSDEIFDAIEIYDFYRYCDVSLDELMSYLQSRLPWVRPKDTGRSTNCLINDVGIHVHKLERGFHNYSLPYSWDVRLGHKNRTDALEELNDDIDLEHVNRVLDEVGYTIHNAVGGTDDQLALYYTAEHPLDSEQLRQQLQSLLPGWMIPDWIVHLDKMPINNNGKLDKSALPQPAKLRSNESAHYVEPATQVEKQIAKIWCEQLKVDRVGIHDNFFELGGDSLAVIRIAAKINAVGLKFSSADIFRYQTVAQISERCVVHESATKTPVETDQPTQAFSSLGEGQLDKLANILGKSRTKPGA